jgi:tetratricopeptide (TPR) repeat protein
LLFGISGWARGDAASDLYAQAESASNSGDYAGAAAQLDQLLTNYPSTAGADNIRLEAADDYLHAGNFDQAIATVGKAIKKDAAPEIKLQAFLIKGQAQFSKAGKAATPAEAKPLYQQAMFSFNGVIQTIAKTPGLANTDAIEEEAMYYRSLAFYGMAQNPRAEGSLTELVQKFPQSPALPDYLLLLGSVQANQATDDFNNKSSADVVTAAAQKALETYDQIIANPNAPAQANDARLAKAGVLLLVANLTPQDPAGFQKALDVYRTVQRKADLVQSQQARVAHLRAQLQQQVQSSGHVGVISPLTGLIELQQRELDTLQSETDPIVQALIGSAECYNGMREGDEARTILRRLDAATISPPLPDDQAKRIDFDLIYSYVLAGQNQKADTALTAYLQKHPGDSQADSISVNIANNLLQRRDYQGALAQALRSQHDFPQGSHYADAVAAQASALTGLGRQAESVQVIEAFTRAHPDDPAAVQMALTSGQNQLAQNDFNAALATFNRIRAGSPAGDLQAAAWAYAINALSKLGHNDDVVTQSKAFLAQYAQNSAAPSVAMLSAMALQAKKDPGAIAALQQVAHDYAQSDQAPFALYEIVTVYQEQHRAAEAAQALAALRAAFPDATQMIGAATELVAGDAVAAKKFDDAIALYQPLATSTKPEVAGPAQNKIAGLWVQKARAMGAYQSLNTDESKAEAQKRLATAEDDYVNVLKTYPENLAVVNDAFDGLDDLLALKRRSGLVTDAGMEAELTRMCAPLTSPEMQARVEMAKVHLAFGLKDAAAQYPAMLQRFEQAMTANSTLKLTRTEVSDYGELLVAAKEYDKAIQVFTAFHDQADPDDAYAQADAAYGLGAAYLAQGDLDHAKKWFTAMMALPGGAAWHKHILTAQYGVALANQKSDPEASKQVYAEIMTDPRASSELQAKSLLQYGRILQSEGYAVKPAQPGTIEYAVHYFEQVDLFYGAATPEQSAEGLYLAGKAYEQAGDAANAAREFAALRSTYAKTAPDWVAKAPPS